MNVDLVLVAVFALGFLCGALYTGVACFLLTTPAAPKVPATLPAFTTPSGFLVPAAHVPPKRPGDSRAMQYAHFSDLDDML